MRRFLLVIMGMVCAVSSTAQTSFTAVWHCTNFVSQPTAILGVNLTPIGSIFGITNQVLAGETITGQTDSNGVVTFTNLLAGFAYRFELDVTSNDPLNPVKRIVHTNGFPPGLTGTVAAEPYDGIQFPGNVPFAYFNTNAPIANITPLTIGINANGQSISNASVLQATNFNGGTFTGSGSGLTSLPAASITGAPASGIVYVSQAGNDATAVRNSPFLVFKTITAAANAAHSGDLIYIQNPGSIPYNENNFCRAGKVLSWYFEPGQSFNLAFDSFAPATIAFTCPTNDLNPWGFWDDRTSGAVTNYVYGLPNLFYSTGTNWSAQTFNTGNVYDPPWDGGGTFTGFIYSFGPTQALGMVVMTNSPSRFYAQFGDITFQSAMQNSASFAIADVCATNMHIEFRSLYDGMQPLTSTNSFGVFATPYIDVPDGNLPIWMADNGNGVIWQNGNSFFRGDYLDCFSLYAYAWLQQMSNTTDINGYFHVDDCEGYMYGDGLNQHFASWVFPGEILCQHPASAGYETLGGGKHYLLGCGKIQNANVAAPVVELGGKENWVTSQSIKSPFGLSSLGLLWSLAGTTNHVNVDHFFDQGTSVRGIQNAGILHLTFQDMNVNGVAAVGITNQSGGTLFAAFQSITMADGIGIGHGGGTMKIKAGPDIDCSAGTHTNDWPVFANGSGLDIGTANLIAPSAATYSIFSTTAQTVSSSPARGNKGAGPNITMSHGTSL